MKDTLRLRRRGLQPPLGFIIRNTQRFLDLMTLKIITSTFSVLRKQPQLLDMDSNTPAFLLKQLRLPTRPKPGSLCLLRAQREIRVMRPRTKHLPQVDKSLQGPQTQWTQSPSYL